MVAQFVYDGMSIGQDIYYKQKAPKYIYDTRGLIISTKDFVKLLRLHFTIFCEVQS